MFKNDKKYDKIGILTYHFPYNCGAMLQAYALEKVMSKKCNCEIINYAPYYHTKEYIPKIKSYIGNSNSINPIKSIKNAILGFYSYFKDNNHIRKHNFESFQRMISKSKKMVTEAELKNSLHNYSKIIVGSDQVWKKRYDNYCFEYFLKFDKLDLEKYSYATSAGSCFPAEDLPMLKDYLSDFRSISVREKVLADQLIKGGLKCRLDIDPTLLLKKEDYLQIEKKAKVKAKYIFVYLCHDDRAVEALEFLSKVFDAEIVLGPFVNFKTKINSVHKSYDYLGPREFLYCIHHASFVVSSSFHCTVFSILYSKPFLVFDGVGKFERIENLLDLTDLKKHVFKSIESIDFSNDYRDAQRAITFKVELSNRYLESIINDQ